MKKKYIFMIAAACAGSAYAQEESRLMQLRQQAFELIYNAFSNAGDAFVNAQNYSKMQLQDVSNQLNNYMKIAGYTRKAINALTIFSSQKKKDSEPLVRALEAFVAIAEKIDGYLIAALNNKGMPSQPDLSRLRDVPSDVVHALQNSRQLMAEALLEVKELLLNVRDNPAFYLTQASEKINRYIRTAQFTISAIDKLYYINRKAYDDSQMAKKGLEALIEILQRTDQFVQSAIERISAR